jgi:hypothetical protein
MKMQKTHAVIPAESGWRLLIYDQEHPERLRYESIIAWEIQNDETTRKVIPISFETPNVEDCDQWGVVRPDGNYVINGKVHAWHAEQMAIDYFVAQSNTSAKTKP